MEILAIVLLLMGLFSTVAGVVTEDIDVLICAGIFYLCCWRVLIRVSKEKEVG